MPYDKVRVHAAQYVNQVCVHGVVCGHVGDDVHDGVGSVGVHRHGKLAHEHSRGFAREVKDILHDGQPGEVVAVDCDVGDIDRQCSNAAEELREGGDEVCSGVCREDKLRNGFASIQFAHDKQCFSRRECCGWGWDWGRGGRERAA